MATIRDDKSTAANSAERTVDVACFFAECDLSVDHAAHAVDINFTERVADSTHAAVVSDAARPGQCAAAEATCCIDQYTTALAIVYSSVIATALSNAVQQFGWRCALSTGCLLTMMAFADYLLLVEAVPHG